MWSVEYAQWGGLRLAPCRAGLDGGAVTTNARKESAQLRQQFATGPPVNSREGTAIRRDSTT